ncbi:MAG: YjzC family protein [Oscillospiraceae bacterium]|jgi:hypothetical protein|nr:YjzC family protein [Oscillospiraceae bacterium]
MSDLIKPGTDDQPAGDYIEVTANGEMYVKEHKVTIQKGDRLPPTSKSGNCWKKAF